MGQVTVKARIENVKDSWAAKAGVLGLDKVRFVEVDHALVDTGAKLLSLPKRLVQQLGLEYLETRNARTAAGIVPCNIYGPVCLTIAGRRCTVDVAELPVECPVLIGYYPLELLDFVVDPVGQRLIDNPQNGGQRLLDLF